MQPRSGAKLFVAAVVPAELLAVLVVKDSARSAP